ncbi:hypothetical protein BKA70DRAFT_593828 [Coprinopsis sp. MPI-PUGE-AT-0042]|nr:hypothetical protein BKA70DRAFT_593828 [Coprinopsis sp. MPI-PUGE-AT-0042]
MYIYHHVTQAPYVEMSTKSSASMLRAICGHFCLAVAYVMVNAGTITLAITSSTTLSLSIFFIVRYRQGDQPPTPMFPITCGYIAASSLATIISCVVATSFEILKKVRWVYWVVASALWLGGAVGLYLSLGWKEEYGRWYCEIVQIPHCMAVKILAIFSIFMIFGILWHACETSWKDWDDRRPFRRNEISSRSPPPSTEGY